MNMQTAPGKFYSASFFSIVLLLPLACTSSDQAPTQADLSENHGITSREATSQAFAKLIDRELAALYPQLRPHQGQIVLGQTQLQIVSSSVPPLSGGSIFYPLLNAAYKATGKTWQQQTWLPPWEINISSVNGETLSLIGQDVETQNGVPRLISYFRGPTPALGQVRLVMEWFNGSTLVKFSLQQEGGSTALRWKLRLPSGYGEEHAIPFDQHRVRGVTVSLLPDVITLLSQTPLDMRSDARQSLLTAAPTPALNTSFMLLIGRDAALQQPALVSQLKSCRGDCWKLPPQTVAWQIQMPARRLLPRTEKRLFQSLFVHDDQGGFVSTLSIDEGEQLRWNLPADAHWEVLYPDEQGVLKSLKFDHDTRSAQLPPFRLGSVQVNLNPGRPSFVELRDAVRKSSVAWARQLAPRPADLVSAHSFLQKNWPLNAQLPAGDYQLQILDGMHRLCAQRFTILPGRHQVIHCNSEEPKASLSPRANLSLDATISEDMLEAAHFQAIGRVLRSGKEGEGSRQDIPMLLAEDPNLGLSLRALPADEILRKTWLAVKPKDSDGLLPAFARFAREQNPPLLLVLQCPEAGFQFEDYRWLALTIAPDIIEVLGCQQPDLAEALLQVAHKLQQKTSIPIKFAAAAPFWGRDRDSDFIPALYVPRTDNIISALRKGNYSLGFRSEMAVTGPLPTAGVQEPQTLTFHLRSYDLRDQTGFVRVYDQYGLLAEQTLPATRDTEQKLSLTLRLRPVSRFLRLELWGQGLNEVRQEGLTQPFLLATSNFLGLNGPPSEQP